MTDPFFRYRDFLKPVSSHDADAVLVKDIHYHGSWKRRGGVGAFMMCCRKWDRIEPICKEHDYDIFEAHKRDGRTEGMIDDIRDLRRYLLLIECELMAQGAVKQDAPEPQPFLSLPETADDRCAKHIHSRAVDGMTHPFGYDREVDEV